MRKQNLPDKVLRNASSSFTFGWEQMFLWTTQYSGRSSSLSASSGKSVTFSLVGSQDVRPTVRPPLYSTFVPVIRTTSSSPGISGCCVKTYPLQKSPSCLDAVRPSAEMWTLRPVVELKGICIVTSDHRYRRITGSSPVGLPSCVTMSLAECASRCSGSSSDDV